MKNDQARRVLRTLSMSVALLGASLTIGCGSSDVKMNEVERSDIPDSIVEESSPLYAASTKVWASPHIKVCWESVPSPDYRAAIRQAIRNSWELESNVTFDGWGLCTPTSTGLRVRLYNGALAFAALGKDLNGVVNGLSLPNFQSGVCLTGWTAVRCAQAAAVRGFGHALGFALEQNRSDPPGNCLLGPSGPSGDTYIGAFDTQSVMSNCNSLPFGDGKLSGTDIQGVQEFYGGPRSISAVAWAPGRLDVFVRGGGSKLYQRFYNGGWVGSSFGDLGGSLSSAPSVVSWGANRLDIVARGTDGQLKYLAWNGSAWSGWASVAGPAIIGSPRIVSWGPNRLDVFARAVDKSVVRFIYNGSSWSSEPMGFVTLPPVLPGDPGIYPVEGDIVPVSRGAGTIDIFVRIGDGGLIQRTFSGGAWGAWSGSVGSASFPARPCAGLPDAIALSSTKMMVACRAPLGFIQYRVSTNGLWDDWWSFLNGTFTSGPRLVRRSATAAEIFTRGEDGYVWFNSWNGTNFLGWNPHEFLIRGQPEVVAWDANRLDLFVRANSDNTLRHTAWTPSTWWSAFQNLGGSFR